MKKGLLMLGVAALALASCTNEEVLNVSDSRAIGFDAFVGKTTKADITDANISEFYVYGGYDNNLTNVFDNVKYIQKMRVLRGNMIILNTGRSVRPTNFKVMRLPLQLELQPVKRVLISLIS